MKAIDLIDESFEKQRSSLIKKSTAYKVAEKNNIDTDIIEGKKPDENSGEVKFEKMDETESRIFMKDVADFFLKDLPRDTLISIGKGGVNLGHFLNNVAYVLDPNVDEMDQEAYDNLYSKLDEIKKKLGTFEEDSPFISKLVSMLPQSQMYTYPIYKKLNNSGLPKGPSLIISSAMSEALAFDKSETFFTDSRFFRAVKETFNLPADTPYEEVVDKFMQFGEYLFYTGAGEKLLKGILDARKIKAEKAQQGAIAVGAGAAAGAAVSQLETEFPNQSNTEIIDANESEEKKTLNFEDRIKGDQSMIPGTTNEYGYELQAGAVPIFKSILKKVAGDQADKLSGEQLFNTIKNTKGIKTSELKWSGADEFMRKNPNATKEELYNFIDQNEFRIKEVDFDSPYGQLLEELDDLPIEEDIPELAAKYNFPKDRINELEEYRTLRANIEGSRAHGDNFGGSNDNVVIKVEGFGGKDIRVPIANFEEDFARELKLLRDNSYEALADDSYYDNFIDNNELFYSPSKKSISYDKGTDGVKIELIDAQDLGSVQNELYIRDAEKMIQELGPDFVYPKFERFTVKGGEKYKVKAFAYDDGQAPYTKTSEIDLGDGSPRQIVQKGKLAYSGGHFQVDGEFAHVRYKERNINGKKTIFIEEMQSDLGQFVASGKFPGTNVGDKVDFPFRNTWYEVVLKRMIRDAADNGFDQIAIPSGIVAARRYGMDLSLSNIQVTKGVDRSDDLLQVYFNKPGGVFSSQRMSFEDAEKLLPPDVYRDITQFREGTMTATAKEGDRYSSVNYTGSNRFEAAFAKNVDIVQPENVGKVSLYDKAIPSFLKKYGKKWGSKVTVIDSSEEKLIRPYQMDLNLKFDDDGVMYSTIDGQDLRPIQNLLDDKDFKIFVIEISPSMKKSVQEEGQSLFEYFGPVIAGGAASKAVLEDQGNNTISN